MIDWGVYVVVLGICGAITTAIAMAKNREPIGAFFLGALLGIFGIIIMALLPKQLPKAPPGTFAVKCPRCNAVQNVPNGDKTFACWQCHSTTSVAKTAAARSVQCPKCDTNQKVPSNVPSFQCVSCKTTLNAAY